MRASFLFCFVVVAAGCFDAAVDRDVSVACGGDTDCPSPLLCRAALGRCVAAQDAVGRCGDSIVDVDEACDDGNLDDDDECRSNCALSSCGDGVIQPPESCDNGAGNDDAGACTSRCLAARCGDGFTQLPETCDSPPNLDASFCTSDCQLNVCGDGHLFAGVEACDDGNDVDEDGCTNGCTLPRCGDGITQAGEDCDDDNDDNEDGCLDVCVFPFCGDGFQNTGDENCDDGDRNDDRGFCTTTCRAAFCGDGSVLDGFEACDGVGCAADCSKAILCGDGVVDAGEGCDDGNANDADACSNGCEPIVWTASAIGGLGTAGGQIERPRDVAVDRAGNLFVADSGTHRIFRIAPDGTVVTIAGSGVAGAGIDGVATASPLNVPRGLVVDNLGNVIFVDQFDHSLRKVTPDGRITTLLSKATREPDGSPTLDEPVDVVIDGRGVIFVADNAGCVVRQLDPDGTVSTVAGLSRVATSTGNDGLASAATLAHPVGLAVDADNLYIGESDSHVVRRISRADGVIHAFAGDGTTAAAVDGVDPLAAPISQPGDLEVGADGAVYIVGRARSGIFVVRDNVFHVIVGGRVSGFVDGDLAVSFFDHPDGIAVDDSGVIVVADTINGRVRRVDVEAGLSSTISGDGQLATPDAPLETELDSPDDVAVDENGDLYIADAGGRIVYRLSADGRIAIVIGDGTIGPNLSNEGGPAVDSNIATPRGMVFDRDGNLLIVEGLRGQLRRIDRAGNVTTIVNRGGIGGFSGDGGLARDAQLRDPRALALDDNGDLFIADSGNHRVRKVDLQAGSNCDVVACAITTVAGNGNAGGGVDGPASATPFQTITGLAVRQQTLLIADSENNVVRQLNLSTGAIGRFAGTGSPGLSGDGAAATAARIKAPADVAVRADGRVLIADSGNRRIREVGLDGVIHTLVGTGGNAGAPTGEGGPAAAAHLGGSLCVDVDRDDHVLFCDSADDRIVIDDGSWHAIVGAVFPPTDSLATASLSDLVATTRTADNTLLLLGGQRIFRVDGILGSAVDVVVGYPNGLVVGDSPVDASFADAFASAAAIVVDGDRAFVSDRANHVIRLVDMSDPDPQQWTVRNFAGAAGIAAHNDGALVDARFDGPAGLALAHEAAGDVVYVADSGNHVVRAIDVDAGVVSTVAGVVSAFGFFGEDVDARSALFFSPEGVAVRSDGAVVVSDTGNHRVRVIEGAGDARVVHTIIGDGSAASSGEGTPAFSLPVDQPAGLTFDRFGNLFIASRQTVREVTAGDDGLADRDDAVITVYGRSPRSAFPQNSTNCVAGVTADDVASDADLLVTDRCLGLLLRVTR